MGVKLHIDSKAMREFYYGSYMEVLNEKHEVIEVGGVRLLICPVGVIDPEDGTEMCIGMSEEAFEAVKRGEDPPYHEGRDLDDETYLGSDGVVVHGRKVKVCPI